MVEEKHHNSLGGSGADQLRAYVARIERLEEEIKGLNDDKREIYAEAKSCGFDKATLRKLIARRRKASNDLQEEDALLELYEAAIAAPPKDPLED